MNDDVVSLLSVATWVMTRAADPDGGAFYPSDSRQEALAAYKAALARA